MAYKQYRPSGFKMLPDVVKNLLIINVLMFVGGWVIKNRFEYDITKNLGLFYIHSDMFRPFQFVSHLFMHDLSNPAHVLLNMFALWMFGNMLENYWGAKRFLIFYIVCGLGAALCQSIVTYFQIHGMETAVDAYIASPDIVGYEALVKNYFSNFNIPGIHSVDESIAVLKELVEARKNIPTVGASGAVFGVLLAFGMTFPNTMIMTSTFSACVQIARNTH